MPTTTTGVATTFIDFTRASNATVTDSDGKVKWAPHNLLTNSESFDASAWTQAAVTRTANQTAAPNGSITADLLKPVASTAEHMVYSGTTVSATMLTYGLFVKANGYTKVALRESASTGSGCAFDLSGSGSVIGVYNAGAATVTNPSIVPLANSWFYISCTVNFASATNQSFAVLVLSPSYVSGTDIYATWLANGTDSVYLWGAHLYRSDLAMQPNTSAYPMYNPTTPKNRLGFTEAFSDAAWTKTGLAATPVIDNTVVAPNGLQTADKIVESTANSTHGLFNAVGLTPTNTAPYVYSIYAKAAERSMIIIDAFTFTSARTWFNLANGTVGTNASGSTASIQSVGNGWYRCSVIRNATDTTNQFLGVYIASSDGVNSYTGDGTSGIYVWGAQLSDSASLDSYSPVYGAAVTSAAYYGPRRDFDPVTLACKGLLVEEQRANLLLRSEELNLSPWVAIDCPVTADQTTAPSGVSTADRMLPNTANSQHYVYQSATLVSGQTYTLSIYAKPNGYKRVLLREGSFSGKSVAFDVSTGAVVGTDGATGQITAVGNGWYRCAMTFSAISSASTVLALIVLPDTGTSWADATFAANGTSGLFVWGAQAENASFATSYIPVGSTTAGATRLADVAQVSTAAFPYSATEGTIVVNVQHMASPSSQNQAHWQIIGASNILSTDRFASSTSVAVRGLGLNADSSKTLTTNVAKVGTSFTTTEVNLLINGGSAYTNTSASGTLSGAVIFNIGNVTGTSSLNGWMRQVTYLPRKLSVSELQTRTQ